MNISEFLSSSQFLLPAAFIVGGLVLGIILERLLLYTIRRRFEKSGRYGYRAIRRGLRGMIALWSTIIGLYIAIRFISLSSYVESIYQRVFVVLIIFTVTLAVMRITAGLVDLYIARRGVRGPVSSETRVHQGTQPQI